MPAPTFVGGYLMSDVISISDSRFQLSDLIKHLNINRYNHYEL